MNSAYHETPDGRVKVYQGDARRMLEVLPEKSVQCVITSPPYWGLRKYEGEQELIWEGQEGCEHEWGSVEKRLGAHHAGETNPGKEGYTKDRGQWSENMGQFCSLCEAWHGAYGLEPSVELYIAHSMLFLDVLWKVLKDDGVVFWDLGDSYAGSGAVSGEGARQSNTGSRATWAGGPEVTHKRHHPPDGFKPKSLCLIPERFALAAQERGWIVRSRIAWVKPNPMPESVTDRPTGSWETIWMLTKGPRYYYDQEAVREKLSEATFDRAKYLWATPNTKGYLAYRGLNQDKPYAEAINWAGRNLRDVWEFPTEPYPLAHFATFPRELVRRCVLAATSEKGNCSKCGKPWARVIEQTGHVNKREPAHQPGNTPTKVDSTGWSPTTRATGDWKPTCSCDAPTEPALVLDPFAGSGTTLEVAYHLGRRAVGFDLSAAYCDLAVERLRQGAMALSG